MELKEEHCYKELEWSKNVSDESDGPDGRSEDEVSDDEVYCPEEITCDDYRLVNKFITTISRYYYYAEAQAIDLLKSLNSTMNSLKKLEYLVHRIYVEASKCSNYHLSLHFAKICKICCCITWIHGKEIKKTFEEILVDRIHEDFDFNKSKSKLKQRISYVLKDYKGPEHKKEHWINLRMKEFLPLFRSKGPRNVEFIHGLFLNWIIIPADLHLLIENLLETPDNNSLILLCKLLKEIGKDLDFRHHREGCKQWEADDRLDPYFLKIKAIAQNKSSDISKEVQAQLLEIMLLRIRGWTESIHQKNPWNMLKAYV